MVDTKKVGVFIAQCRKEHNWTQKELGEKLGVTDKAVSKWTMEFPIVKDTTPNMMRCCLWVPRDSF